MPLDKTGQEERAKEFNRFLAFIDKVREESAARLAESGEKPIKMVVGIDHLNKKLAVFPVEEAPPAAEN